MPSPYMEKQDGDLGSNELSYASGASVSKYCHKLISKPANQKLDRSPCEIIQHPRIHVRFEVYNGVESEYRRGFVTGCFERSLGVRLLLACRGNS